MAGRLKQKSIDKPPKLSDTLNENLVNNHVSFTFIHLINNNDKYTFDCDLADNEKKLKLLNSLKVYSSQTWDTFASGNKYSTGVEYVKRDTLRDLQILLPQTDFYNKIKGFYIFRIGRDHRLVGHRIGNICYILWFDWNLTSYNHGS